MKSSRTVGLAVGGLVLLGVAAWLTWQARTLQPPPPPHAAPAAAPPSVAVEPPPAAPTIQYPVDNIASPSEGDASPLPTLDGSDSEVESSLMALLGRRQVLSLLQLDGFVRRVVATVDNLGQAHAPPLRWPVNPMPGRFSTRELVTPEAPSTTRGAPVREVIGANNGARYDAFVALVQAAPMAPTVAWYKRHYPLFQQAYEELGYPHGYFNDRLVQVVDLLLATPVPVAPVAVVLTEVKGPIASQRPWVRYEFADPALQGLAAGQKMLIRTGARHQRQLMDRLRELRAQLVATPHTQPDGAAPY